MKKVFKTLSLMMFALFMSTTFTSCSDDDNDGKNPDTDTLIGYWYSDDEEIALYLSEEGNGKIANSSLGDLVELVWNSQRITAGGQTFYIESATQNTLVISDVYGNYYFKRISKSEWNSITNDSSSGNDDKYSGEKWVGSWQGGDGYDEVYITLGADGSYTDYYVINGKVDQKYKQTTTYTVSNNSITISGDCNYRNCWGSKAKISYSGNNKMTWTSDMGDKITLNRK